jgi:hypothetical protein
MRALERRKGRRAIRQRVFADLWQDVTYAFRSLSRQPLFVVTAALTLGLGIGVNAAIFSAVDSFLLRPLPLRAADRLLVLNYIAPGTDLPSTITWLNAVDLQGMTNIFEDVVAWDNDVTNVRTQENDGERMITGNVSSNFFAALQPRMALGRGITFEEGEARTPVIVLDYRVWERKFSLDPGVLGRAVYLNGQPFTVVGVTAPEFRGPESIVVYNVYIPITTTPLINPATRVRFEQRDRGSVRVLAHLKSGVSVETAREALKEFGGRQAQLYPKENSGTIYIATPETRARPDPAVSSGVMVTASVFLALCGLVLLVA